MAEASQNQQPDPQVQYLQAAAEQAQAMAAEQRAKTVETIASAGLKLAQTDKTRAETQGAHQDQQIATLDTLQKVLQPTTTKREI